MRSRPSRRARRSRIRRATRMPGATHRRPRRRSCSGLRSRIRTPARPALSRLRKVAEPKTKQELDQEWGELVEEHRLAMPGVQVLFAFLLILPFQNRFERLTENQEYVYFSALVCSTL